MERENKRVDMIGDTLKEAIDRMESVAGEGCGYLPDVVRLVDESVDTGVMKPAVDPVDCEISEEQEGEDTQRNLK